MATLSGTQQLIHQAKETIIATTGVDHVDQALILGSGWSQGAAGLGEVIAKLALVEVPGFSQPIVAGHGGELLLVRGAAHTISMVMTGRTHLYEGRGVGPVVHGVRTAAALGATTIILTNGCGSVRPDWGPGTVVAIKDHLNLTGVSPLVGPEFVDMSDSYSATLRTKIRAAGLELPEGVYAQFGGPQYETPAEVRMAGILGADLVGMSTALETIAARACKMQVLGLSLVCNFGTGVSSQPLSHQEVLQIGRESAPRLQQILRQVLPLVSAD